MSRKKKKSLPLLILAGVLALSVVALILLRNGSGDLTENNTTAGGSDQTVLSIDGDSVTSLSYTYDGETLTFTRNGDSWLLKDEEAFPLDIDTVDGMLGTITSITADYVLENIDDPAEFGLADPVITVVATDSKGGHTDISIGDAYPYGSDRYIAINGDTGTIYVAPNKLYSYFSVKRNELLEEEPLPTISSSNITGIVMLSDEFGTYSLSCESEAAHEISGMYPWLLITGEGRELAVDTDRIGDILDAASAITLGDRVDYREDRLDEYGINSSSGMISVIYTQQQTETITSTDPETGEDITSTITENVPGEITLVIGDKADDEDYYVNVSGTGNVYLWANSSINALTIDSPEDMEVRYLGLVPWNMLSAMELTCDSYSRRYTFETVQSTDDNGNASESRILKLDGKVIDEDVQYTVQGHYADLIGLKAADRHYNGAEPGSELFRVDYTTTNEQYPTYTIVFYELDDSYCLAVVNGTRRCCVDIRDVRKVMNEFR